MLCRYAHAPAAIHTPPALLRHAIFHAIADAMIRCRRYADYNNVINIGRHAFFFSLILYVVFAFRRFCRFFFAAIAADASRWQVVVGLITRHFCRRLR